MEQYIKDNLNDITYKSELILSIFKRNLLEKYQGIRHRRGYKLS